MDNEYTEADILYKSQYSEQEVIVTEDCTEALLYVLGTTSRVDMEQICKIVDKDLEEVLNELGEKVFLNPMSLQWEESSKWLSGNVYKKMKDVEKYMEDHGIKVAEEHIM